MSVQHSKYVWQVCQTCDQIGPPEIFRKEIHATAGSHGVGEKGFPNLITIKSDKSVLSTISGVADSQNI